MYTRLKRWSDARNLSQSRIASTKAEDKENISFLRGSTYEREKEIRPGGDGIQEGAHANPQSAVTLNYLDT